MVGNHWKWLGGALLLGACLNASIARADDGTAEWRLGGKNKHNTRYNDAEYKINAGNVKNLKQKWAFTTHGDVSATPTVQGDSVYAVDWGGYLYSINKNSGVPNWSAQIKTYTGNTVGSVSRTSPAISGDDLIIGDQGDLSSGGLPQGGGQTASVMAVDKTTGALKWRTVVSDHPFSCITSSPCVHNGIVYVGVASLEENGGFIPGYTFSYRGRVLALDASTGAPVWKQPFITISDDAYAAGFVGASIWGSTPVVDENRCTLFVGTGNNYSAPAGYTSPGGLPSPDDDHFDSILALDLATGNLKWHFRAWNGDKWDVFTWEVLDGEPVYTYPNNTALGPDWDFGSGPNLITRPDGSQFIGCGAKSGIYYCLNPDNGTVVWKTQVGPGGTGGGIEWGSATDGSHVFSAISNSSDLVVPQFGATYTGGLWAAVNTKTGVIDWQTADPLAGHDYGMVSLANGVVYAASAGNPINAAYPAGAPGGFFALDASTGKILWQFTIANDPAMGSSICGPSIVDGTVYWGSGYSHLFNAFGISGVAPKLYAFSLP